MRQTFFTSLQSAHSESTPSTGHVSTVPHFSGNPTNKELSRVRVFSLSHVAQNLTADD
jgi:hypothetical protein